MHFKDYVFVNFTSTSCCFLFLIFLFITYFLKKNMKNIENSIYRHMLISNGICLLFYMLSYGSFIFYQYEAPIAVFFSKTAPIFLALWSLLIFYYVIVIVNEQNKNIYSFIEKNNKKFISFIYFLTLIVAIVTYLEKISFDYRSGTENNAFLCVSVVFYISFLTIFVIAIIGRKKITKKKALPLYLIIVICIVAFFINLFGSDVIIMFIMMTVINHLMYHTIENPDMKMVAELTLAKETAEKALNAKSDFLSSMSHELRTPLNSIIGLADVMETSNDLDELHLDLKDISISSKKLLELVDGILAVNAIDSNNVQIVNVNYDLNILLNEINSNILLRIGDKPLQFRIKCSDNIPQKLYGDKNKIKTIVIHLLSNAVKYTNEGLIELTIDGTLVKDKCNLKITVTDTGKGISEKDINNIFNKFYRSEENKDSDISGTGLGLSITKSLVELLDGKITVNSVLGEGTTFTVSLSQMISSDNGN